MSRSITGARETSLHLVDENGRGTHNELSEYMFVNWHTNMVRTPVGGSAWRSVSCRINFFIALHQWCCRRFFQIPTHFRQGPTKQAIHGKVGDKRPQNLS